MSALITNNFYASTKNAEQFAKGEKKQSNERFLKNKQQSVEEWVSCRPLWCLWSQIQKKSSQIVPAWNLYHWQSHLRGSYRLQGSVWRLWFDRNGSATTQWHKATLRPKRTESQQKDYLWDCSLVRCRGDRRNQFFRVYESDGRSAVS